MQILISLSDTDKKVLLALLLGFIMFIIIFVLITLTVAKISKSMSYKLDKVMHDSVVTGAIKNEKEFKKNANIKNRKLFFKESSVPLLIIFISSIAMVIFLGVKGNMDFGSLFADYGVRDINGAYKGGHGFATILYLWDFSSIPTVNFFGLTIISDWPPILQVPHFEVEAIVSYIFVPIFCFGIGYFLITCQAYIARLFRISKLSKSIYIKKLDNVTFNSLANFKNQNGVVTYDRAQQPTNKEPSVEREPDVSK